MRCVAVDPANEWFATGSADRTIKIWDLASGQLKLTLTGHIEQVRGWPTRCTEYGVQCTELRMRILELRMNPGTPWKNETGQDEKNPKERCPEMKSLFRKWFARALGFSTPRQAHAPMAVQARAVLSVTHLSLRTVASGLGIASGCIGYRTCDQLTSTCLPTPRRYTHGALTVLTRIAWSTLQVTGLAVSSRHTYVCRPSLCHPHVSTSTLHQLSPQVTGLAVSSRHPYMFSCGLDKMVKCWDLEQNKVGGRGNERQLKYCKGGGGGAGRLGRGMWAVGQHGRVLGPGAELGWRGAGKEGGRGGGRRGDTMGWVGGTVTMWSSAGTWSRTR